MKNRFKIIFSTLTMLSASMALHADQQGDKEADQRRLEQIRQDQQIQDRQLEDQREEQRIIDRKLEEKRQEQRRLDNARNRRLDVADRGGRGGRGDRGRRMETDDQDLMDDTIDERFLERNALQNRNQYPVANEQQAAAAAAKGACLTCDDRTALDNYEASQKQNTEYYQHRKAIVEKWDRDHPRD